MQLTRNETAQIPQVILRPKYAKYNGFKGAHKGEMLFIITEKARAKERKWDGVGVMKDKELKLEDVKAPTHFLFIMNQ